MSITGMCPNLVESLSELEAPEMCGEAKRRLDIILSDFRHCSQPIERGLLEFLMQHEGCNCFPSEEMIEIPPKDEVDANMIKRGFLKPIMRPKTILIEYKPRTRE